ncbi:hypothetical protein EZS27_007133 [termite gut metagenome]|uniref:Uncharacterized protein n=1 Tax=termite gut metagenome TaxID=433724 RepID=A0A5J4SJ31_9ZZZZ
MFHKLITNKRNQWLKSDSCTICEMIAYIERQAQMRDAQIEAIKTYLFLKIACNNQPLWKLFADGTFNTLTIDELELTTTARNVLRHNKAAMAFMEYSRLTDKTGKQLAPELERFIKTNTADIDYEQAFKNIFYNTTYPDYLYSLPMGAGKTFLMAAFIYLDLYFAQNEPENKAFAHNFIIFAPSGLKSSVVPSLKTIQRFDPSWIIPEPAASNLKRWVKFEVLDEQKSQKKSNKTKNPNTQKINRHQPLDDLMGLVAVTNAEKVILERVQANDSFFGHDYMDTEDEKDRQANELRNIIGKIPNLAVYIDEVHHAMDEDIKLRKVVTQWMEKDTFNSVVGFSGTPYLEKPEGISIDNRFTIKNIELSNVVYYYPLIDGITNFLKTPVVKISSNPDSLSIVDSGVKDFLDTYKNKRYANGTIAKLGIYCGKIENLEEVIYPRVMQLVNQYGLNASDAVLKYHRGNEKFKITQKAETEFASLDSPLSKIQIVLLVQIGKEGWDCQSLTGVILSQKGDCPTNMVLQTGCRCLRQVDKGKKETALIWLNDFNAEKLNAQLLQQQNITLKEFEKAANSQIVTELHRYSRMDYLKLPPIDFYQLTVRYDTLIVEEAVDIKKNIAEAITYECKQDHIIEEKTIEGKTISKSKEKEQGGEETTFNQWLYGIAKESFNFLSVSVFKPHLPVLQKIFGEISYSTGDVHLLKSTCNQSLVRANIRKAFYERRTIHTIEEIIPEQAALLRIDGFSTTVSTDAPDKYYPKQNTVAKILKADKGEIGGSMDEQTLKAINALESIDQHDMADQLREQHNDIPERRVTYHYLPYRFDSSFENQFLREVLSLEVFKQKGLEIYFNGDRGLTDFKVACYRQKQKSWRYIGQYTPDFLLIKRKSGGEIHQIIIIETKGEGFSESFKDKRAFMESEFLRQNNAQYGYERFSYLYLEDNLTPKNRILKTIDAINRFFKN